MEPENRVSYLVTNHINVVLLGNQLTSLSNKPFISDNSRRAGHSGCSQDTPAEAIC